MYLRILSIQLSIFFLLTKSLSAQYRQISGYVMDSVTLEPVPYVSIGVEGGYQGTVSNSNGAFDFKFDCADTCQLKIASLGYYPKSISVTNDYDTLWLRPASQVLREIVIFAKEVNAYKVVQQAIKSIPKNYITDPFVMKAFYRHYCKDDSTYTRLIEAAFDMYQPKGYKRPYYQDTVFNGRLKLVQARRAFKLYDNGLHPPIALISSLAYDVIGTKGTVYPVALETSFTKPLLWAQNLLNGGYAFTFNKITTWDNEEVYEIGFKKVISDEMSITKIYHTGKLFISSKTHVILRYESKITGKGFLARTVHVDYQRFGEKYALFRVAEEWRQGQSHYDHLEILNNEIIIGKSKENYSNSISRKELAEVTYDSTFWSTYNVIKRSELEEQIAKSLTTNSGSPPNKMYVEEQALELTTLLEEQKHRVQYDSLIRNNNGLLCTVFWRSSERFPLANDYEKSNANIQKLKQVGVKFIFVSLDHTQSFWRNYILEHELSNETHLRVGVSIDDEKYGIEARANFPQYQIRYNKKMVSSNAPPPYSKDFLSLIEKYLTKYN